MIKNASRAGTPVGPALVTQTTSEVLDRIHRATATAPACCADSSPSLLAPQFMRNPPAQIKEALFRERPFEGLSSSGLGQNLQT